MIVEGLRAKIVETYADGLFLVQVTKPDRHAAKMFLSKYFARVKQSAATAGRQEPADIDRPMLTFSFAWWHRARTLNQNALYWALVTILAWESYREFDHEESVHEELLNRYAPRVKTVLNRNGQAGEKPKRSKELTTTEFSRLVEGVFFELAELGVEVDSQYKIEPYWKQWNSWRAKQPIDPLRGTYSGIEDYRKRINYCEACLSYLGGEEHGEVAHIISRGADITLLDMDWNLFRLCSKCHTGFPKSDSMGGFDTAQPQHQRGWESFLQHNEHLRWKVEAAWKRAA